MVNLSIMNWKEEAIVYMKNLLRVLILVVLSVGLYLVVDLIITKGDNKLAMPELKSTSQEFGELTEVKLNESNCEIQKQTLSSFAFVDKEVNGLVEKDIEDLKKQASLKEREAVQAVIDAVLA